MKEKEIFNKIFEEVYHPIPKRESFLDKYDRYDDRLLETEGASVTSTSGGSSSPAAAAPENNKEVINPDPNNGDK